MKNIKIILIALFFATILIGCSSEELNKFAPENSAALFPGANADQSSYPGYNAQEKTFYHYYSFLSAEIGATKAITEIPVRLAGHVAVIDRVVNVRVIKDKTTAQEGNYKILKAVIPANEIYGYIQIELTNEDILKEESREIMIEIIDSKDLLRGPNECVNCKVVYSNMLTPPKVSNEIRSYNYIIKGTVAPSSTALTHYSSNAHQLILLVCGWEKLPSYTASPFFVYVNAPAYAAKINKYVREWNLANPEKPLIHDAGTFKGQVIVGRE